MVVWCIHSAPMPAPQHGKLVILPARPIFDALNLCNWAFEIRLWKNPLKKILRKAWTFWRISCNIGSLLFGITLSLNTEDFFVSEVTSILAAIWTTHVLEWRIGMKQSRRKNRSTTLVRCFLRQQTLRNLCLASKKGKQVPKLKTNPNKICWNLKLEVNKTLDWATKLLLLALAFWVHLFQFRSIVMVCCPGKVPLNVSSA